jgi:hypothetical protein
VNYDLERLRALEIQVTALKGELNGHITLCDGRWRVAWKLVTMISGGIALAVALAVEMLWRP